MDSKYKNIRFTARKRSCAKVMFSAMCVCLSVHRGFPCDHYTSCIGRYHSRPPPHHLPLSNLPRTFRKRSVRILLECFLVLLYCSCNCWCFQMKAFVLCMMVVVLVGVVLPPTQAACIPAAQRTTSDDDHFLAVLIWHLGTDWAFVTGVSSFNVF